MVPQISQANFFSEQIQPSLRKSVDAPSLLLWSSGLLATWALQSQNQQIRDQWGDHKILSAETSHLGDIYVRYGGNASIALIQLFFDTENGLHHTRALLFTGVLTQGLKMSTNEERPDGSDHYSFPSGHTSSAFATATSLSYSYGWRAGIPAYSMAALTGLSRIADNKHWASDVIAGAFLGIIWGRATYHPEKSWQEQESTSSQSSWLPAWEEGQFTLQYSRYF